MYQIVKDNSGVEYSLVPMPPNGLCGFSCIAHCVNGNKFAYMDVIEDSFNVFDRNSNLFIQQTEFGQKRLSLSMYRDQMRYAVSSVSRESVPSMFWLEDAHLVAFSMLYDIAVFVYNSTLKRWLVYNDVGSRGYICLHFNGWHFDILQGTGTGTAARPPIPRRVVRHDMNTVSWNYVQLHKTYSFSGVWTWPSNETDASHSSSTQTRLYSRAHMPPVKTQSSQSNKPVDVVDCASYCKRPNKVSSKQNLPCQKAMQPNLHVKASQLVPCTACNRKFNSLKGLQIHSARKHRATDNEPKMHVISKPTEHHVSDAINIPSMSSNDNFSCSLCVKIFSSLQSLRLHQFRKHEVTSESDIRDLERTAQAPQQEYADKPYEKSEKCTREKAANSYCCSVCGKQFKTVQSLGFHSKKIHRDQKTLSSHDCSNSATAATKTYHCCICKAPFITPRGLQLHQRRKHNTVHHNNNHPERTSTGDSTFHTQTDQSTNPLSKTACLSSSRKQLVDGYCDNRKALNKQYLSKLIDLYEQYPPLNSSQSEETNELHVKLKAYHDKLMGTLSNVSTEKVSQEIQEVVADVKLIDDVKREFKWNKQDQERLNMLNVACKTLPIPKGWFWAANEESQQGIFNEKRMEFCVKNELQVKVIHCSQCKSTGVLVGLDQVGSSLCIDCLESNKIKSPTNRAKFQDAWNKVRPTNETYPKRVETDHKSEDLPILTAGERAIIAAVHPVVTVTKNFIANKKYKQESISLLQNSQKTWSKILPRKDLQNRFIIVERIFKNSCKKHIIANVERVKQWLNYLFENHSEYMRMSANNELEMNNDALRALESQSELAEIVHDQDTADGDLEPEDGIVQTAMESGLSKNEIYTFDKYPNLYLKNNQIVKIKQNGLIEVIEDDSERRPTYNVSANLCFPHLYANGEMSPLDFGDYKLARELLKKQTLFAHKMADGTYRWNYAEDGIHMMHQYAKLTERTVHAMVGFYISQHPEKITTPLQSILKAFKDGMNEDGLLDSQLPDLSAVMSKIPNSRQQWFSERLGLESISRDLGDPNVFITLNMDPRAWPDVRQMIYKLEYGSDATMDTNWFELNTEKYTELLDKFAPQISVYLCRKAQFFLRAFFCGICRIPPVEVDLDQDTDCDWSTNDRYKNGWYWSRVEFTQSRGHQHWHCVAKIGNVLETALLARIIHNGRVVRQELKCGNIRPNKIEQTWTMIEMGLLATRYTTLFAESLSLASFYTQDMNVDSHDDDKVIDVEKLRQDFVENYKNKKVSVSTHPIMRTFSDPECDPNQNVENAKVASVSCMHHCIQNICGGDENGVGCRFSFPKKPLRYTVPAVMQVSADQMETQVLLKRTYSRVPNLNKYFLKYWRANHDVSVLIDAAHKMRYATKYVSKSRKQNELMEEVIDYMGKRSNDLIPPNMKQALTNLILADCSHRDFLSKPELAYKVMNLPEIRKSFNDVSVVGFYPRANLIKSINETDVIIYSDRTEYSAYAERCRPDTVCAGFDKAELESMCFREFVETINYNWKLTKSLKAEPLSPTSRRKLKTRDINSGHWELRKSRTRRHVRWSTVLYSEPAHLYEEVEPDKTTSQTLYFDLPDNKRKQLYRAYQELICYRPWKNSPEESFLSPEVRQQLTAIDPESENRYSLMKLEAFQRVYKDLWLSGEVAPAHSQWHRDNQHSYTQYLTNLHNSEIRLDRSTNKGIFTARYEAADELVDSSVELRLPMNNEVDEADVPSVLNFLPPDVLRGILEQEPPPVSDICVAFPLQHAWQEREEMVKSNKITLFMADPPLPSTRRQDMTFWHNKAIDLAISGEEQIIYVYGKAGTGKTEVALHICKHFKGRVQAGAGTGKAASNFNGPTTHAMFGWSHNEHNQAVVRANEPTKLARLRLFYEKTDIFIIDEVNAMSAAELGLLDEMMGKIFDPDGNAKNHNGVVKPFGGKTMIFLGDAAQLRPVCGAAIYDGGFSGSGNKSGRKSYQSEQYKTRTAKGQTLYREYLSKNCIWLERSFRNKGLLQQIFDRVRNGEQTSDDLDKLLYQRRRYPAVQTDYGIHYSNESCSVSNWLDLWSTCTQQHPPQRVYISRAGYHTTGVNDLIVSSLSAIPASQYNFAPDILCVSEGCEVRLITNLNVSAGLVNSASGTVVKVIYNNADVKGLLDGEHPPAYCIIVNFPQFRGFLAGSERKFPFRNSHWVPLYRQKFSPQRIPSWIRKKQSPSSCYREQFPIDLSRHITAHRAQGQTWKNRLVSVDLSLESPNNHIPPDIGSVIYVACTRTNELQNLFVSPIFPSVWQNIGKSEQDKARRESERKLKTDAEQFAVMHGWHQEFLDEQSFMPDYSNNCNEWKALINSTEPPAYHSATVPIDTVHHYKDDTDNVQVPGWLRPSQRERHIGIDQGVKNFAMVAVDKTSNSLPKVVGAELYNLEQKGLNCKRFDVTDLVVFLQTKTVLMNWMQQPGYQPILPHVDRVIVHLEQVSIANKYSKLFAIELGRLLQRLTNVESCVVKLSQPHIHRASGPMFKLGNKIVQACKLRPTLYTIDTRNSRKRAASKDVKRAHKRRITVEEDVEPDTNSDVDTAANPDDNADIEYRQKKKMSSDIFKYFVHASLDEQLDLQVNITEEVQLNWRELQCRCTVTKFDDLGDALLHALNEVLCGSSNYRPLVPSNPSLHINRTIVLTVLPDQVHFVVLHCSWNLFTLENLGVSHSHLPQNQRFASLDTIELILHHIDPSLRQALEVMAGSDLYTGVEYIKVIVKQLRGYSQHRLSNKAAGALTSATVAAMKQICDTVAGDDSRLCVRNTKQEGWSYIRTMPSGYKMQVMRSTGKHTNAILACLEWAKENTPTFVKNRPLHMNNTDKLKFFKSLQDLSSLEINCHHMEMVTISSQVVLLLRSNQFSDTATQNILADLILIGLNKNGQYVSALAPNYRKNSSRSKT